MAKESDGHTYRLDSIHLVGRGRASALRLESDLVSGEHAVFRWDGARWELRDLGSSNGTFVDGQRLDSGTTIGLKAGALIAFGDPDNLFRLTDTAAPVVSAQVGEQTIYGTEEGLYLPGPEDPECLIRQDGSDRWFLRTFEDARIRRVHDGEEIVFAGRRAVLSLPVIRERTRRAGNTVRRLADIGLRFRVSLDEEHVDVSVVHGDAVIKLRTRAHGYLLLTLARNRLSDSENEQLPESEHGWTHAGDLAGQLGLTKRRFNLYVYRAKRQVADEAELLDFEGLVERRTDAAQIRLGLGRLEIERLVSASR